MKYVLADPESAVIFTCKVVCGDGNCFISLSCIVNKIVKFTSAVRLVSRVAWLNLMQ